MPRPLRSMLLGTAIALTTMSLSPDAQARGGGFAGGGHGGGFAAGGRGGVAAHRPGYLRNGFVGYHNGRHWGGRFGRHDRFGRYGSGGLPFAYGGYGYGPAPSYDPIYRGESQPAYGIPPSPVLPPAIYVIGDKPGKGGQVSVTRQGAGSRVLTVDSRGGAGSGAKVSRADRRHRTR